jgi:hypothetical protein
MFVSQLGKTMRPFPRPGDTPPGEGSNDAAAPMPRPVVNLTVNIKPGKPPPGVLPPERAAEAEKLEKAFLDHLEARPDARAKFLSDPLGTLRGFSPAAKNLVDALRLDDVHANPMFPVGPDARLNALEVNVERPRQTRPRRGRQADRPE